MLPFARSQPPAVLLMATSARTNVALAQHRHARSASCRIQTSPRLGIYSELEQQIKTAPKGNTMVNSMHPNKKEACLAVKPDKPGVREKLKLEVSPDLHAAFEIHDGRDLSRGCIVHIGIGICQVRPVEYVEYVPTQVEAHSL